MSTLAGCFISNLGVHVCLCSGATLGYRMFPQLQSPCWGSSGLGPDADAHSVFNRRVWFHGQTDIDQLKTIFATLGSPEGVWPEAKALKSYLPFPGTEVSAEILQAGSDQREGALQVLLGTGNLQQRVLSTLSCTNADGLCDQSATSIQRTPDPFSPRECMRSCVPTAAQLCIS